MRKIFVFKSGKQEAGDDLVFITSENPNNITQEINMELATDEEWQTLKKNPHNNGLIHAIRARNKHTVQKG